MPIGINDLDDDDVLDLGQEQQSYSPSYLEEDGDIISDILRTKGIEDPTNINFEDDNGLLVSRSWNDLSREELLNILNTPLEQPQQYNYNNDVGLTQDEFNFLSYIRLNGMSPTDYFYLLQEQNSQDNTPQYKIDDLSDDEIYLLDLESRVGEISDEEAAEALNNAKQQNEELYKKQVEGIRREYKEREDYANLLYLNQLYLEQQAAYNLYSNAIVNAINNMNSIGNLDLHFEDADKEDLAEFMLSLDPQGHNYFYEAMLNPENLTKAAWFLLNGEDAFNSITDYFTNLIKMVSDNQYRRGLEDGRKGVQSRPQVVFAQKGSSLKSSAHPTSIYNLDDDED